MSGSRRAALEALVHELRRRPIAGSAVTVEEREGEAAASSGHAVGRDREGAVAKSGDVAPWGARGEVRARGAFFTPRPLVAFVVEETLRPLATPPPDRLTVLDPACGDGRFLVVAAEWAAQNLPGTALLLAGIERDAATAEIARRRLVELEAHGVRGEIRQGEALLGAELEHPVDAVVGNPPYLRSIHLRARDPELWQALRQKFAATSHGEWDLYAPFIERTLGWLRPGGRAGLVVPSRWMTATFAEKLREVVAPSVDSVVDFGALQLFPGATTYASVLFLERERLAGSAALARFAPQEPAGWVESAGDLIERGGAPWILRAGPAHQQLDGAGGTLGEVAQIAKGCGTNADRVFVVRGRCRGAWIEGENGDGAPVRLEASLLRRCLRGRDVEGRAPTDSGSGSESGSESGSDSGSESGSGSGSESAPLLDYCILPYRGLDERGDAPPPLLPWDELLLQAPALAAYLEAHRPALERRERGRFTGPAFYQLGRPQNLRFLLDPRPKIVIPDVAARGRAMLDRGSLVLDSAYAVRPRATASDPWRSPPLLLALLRSPAVRLWLDMVGVPLRGHYFRMKTAFLAPMPLPADGPALRTAASAAEAGDLLAADEGLRQAYGIDAATWQRARRASD